MNEIKTMKKNSKKGFTLVELVVVIAILAILAAIAIPVVSSTIASSQRSAALSNAQTLELALKEAHAMAVAGDKSVYANGLNTTVSDVMINKSLQTMGTVTGGAMTAIDTVTISGDTYTLVWSEADDKCYYQATVGGSTVYLDGAPTSGTPLTVTVSQTLDDLF